MPGLDKQIDSEKMSRASVEWRLTIIYLVPPDYPQIGIRTGTEIDCRVPALQLKWSFPRIIAFIVPPYLIRM